MMDEENQSQSRVLSELDITDEMRIQFAMDEMYEFTKQFDGEPEKITRLKLMRNNILNQMDTYLKKFDNELIMEDFHAKMLGAKQDATKNGRLNKYLQFMNEMRVVQEFKGIKENIADKLADQLFNMWLNSEVIGEDVNALPKNDPN